MTEIKIAIIGIGKMGLLHTGIFNGLEVSKVTAIAEKNKFLVSALRNHLPNVNIYTDYEKMFKNENLDAVVITTPVFLHRSMVEAASDNELNVFVEKPLALDGKECKTILGKNIRKKTSVGYCRRFMETYGLINDVIDQSIMGDVVSFQSQIFVDQVFKKEQGWLYDPEKGGGGVMMDLGSHAIDLSHYFFGDFSHLNAVGKNIYSENVEDLVSINMGFKNGIVGSLDVSWSMKNYRLPELKFNIQFEDGTATVTEKYVEIYSEVEGGPIKKGWNTFYKQSLAKDVPIDIGGPEYTAEDLHFLECIQEEKEPLCNFDESAKTNFVIDAVYCSMKDKKVKKVDYGV